MKKIEAVIRHFKLEEVKDSLQAVGVNEMIVSEVRGFGRQKGGKEQYRGADYPVDFKPKAKLEIFVKDGDVQKAIEEIIMAARTGQIGDGKILVLDVSEVICIRTGERENDAL